MKRDDIANEFFTYKGRMDQLVLSFKDIAGQLITLNSEISDFLEKVNNDPDISNDLKSTLKTLGDKLEMSMDSMLINAAMKNKGKKP